MTLRSGDGAKAFGMPGSSPRRAREIIQQAVNRPLFPTKSATGLAKIIRPLAFRLNKALIAQCMMVGTAAVYRDLGKTLWAKSRQLSWRLRWSRVRLHCRYPQARRMVKSPPAWWVDLSVERCSVALWRRGPHRRRRFITRRRRSMSRSLPAVSFASASGMAMAGKFAASRFAIDRRTFLRSRLEQDQIRPPSGGLFV